VTGPVTGLRRDVGTAGAVVVGLGSMLGAGIFSALGPAAGAAGSALLVGLALAAVVACCNAISSAQLAAQYPVSGGSYVYGRERLGDWWGFAAGWCFVIGKTASCAAMATTFAVYVLPDAGSLPQRAAGVAAAAVLTAVAVRGVTRTVQVTAVLVTVTVGVLALVVGLVLLGGDGESGRLEADAAGWYGTAQSAGLLFFAFAGYARIATMGEEVREPARTIPRAIVVSLALVLVVYAVVAAAVLGVLGADRVATDAAPLASAVEVAGSGWAVPLVAVGAAVAALGSLLALLAGIGRTGLAMGRNHDLPGWLAVVHPVRGVPHRAQLAVGAVVAVLVATVDLRGMIGFSSFGVLLYYSVANAAAWTQSGDERRYPRWVHVVGLVGCLGLVATLPPSAILPGVGVLVLGLLGRLLLRHRVRPPVT
jgi:basic amino acid/polyamine antiporter, APA family